MSGGRAGVGRGRQHPVNRRRGDQWTAVSIKPLTGCSAPGWRLGIRRERDVARGTCPPLFHIRPTREPSPRVCRICARGAVGGSWRVLIHGEERFFLPSLKTPVGMWTTRSTGVEHAAILHENRGMSCGEGLSPGCWWVPMAGGASPRHERRAPLEERRIDRTRHVAPGYPQGFPIVWRLEAMLPDRDGSRGGKGGPKVVSAEGTESVRVGWRG